MEDLKKIKARIDWFCENKVNAFSPTISPAPKSIQRNEIESIAEAINYYTSRGIKELIVQKKYMGSYCDIYLHKNLDDTYFVSRNGHKIEHIDLDGAKNACKELHQKMDWSNLSIVIIQSELMPWNVLGKNLINNEFEGYLNAHQNHLNHLQQTNLYDKIDEIKSSENYIEYIKCKKENAEKEIKKKFASHIIRQYNALDDFKILNLDKYSNGIEIYRHQIAHFGKEEKLHFKPFNILKKIFEDGSEEIVNDNLSYQQVNDDEFLLLKLENDSENQIKKVYNWFATLSNELEEGIIIKPRQAFIKNIPPAFKVRNNHYLTMIYGVDFIERLPVNIGKRKISKKLECSINDWMINWQLLKIKYNTINKENYLLKNLVLDRILGEQIESTLDTRL
ncbi:MAG: hypothetical protein KA174_11160 [Chitinophagales bacterium]|nr:hypothetical protein [Chitinophagales bacterium]